MKLWQLWKRRELAYGLLVEYDYEHSIDYAEANRRIKAFADAHGGSFAVGVSSVGAQAWRAAVEEKAARYPSEDVEASGSAEAS